MSDSSSLWAVIASLLEWQQEHRGKTKSRCLEAVRHACAEHGLKLPQSNVDYHGNLAISCGKRLAEDPSRWGWVRLDKLPADGQPALVFFDRCGLLPDGRVAGHIAVAKPTTEKHFANANYAMNSYWRARVRFVFRPKP